MLEITIKQKGSVAILCIFGEVDVNASLLVEKIAWCVNNGFRDIICNFEEVTFVDYAGLSALAIAYKNVVNHDGRMKFLKVPVHVSRLFSLVYMDTLFETYESLEAVMNAFKEDRIISQIQKKKLRRRFQRLPLEQPVEYKARHGRARVYKGKILNLSAIGALIFCDKVYPLGEIITLKLNLKPQLTGVNVEARVLWHVSKDLQHEIYPGMGLEFYDIDPEVQKKIIEFVERNLSRDKNMLKG